MKGLNPKETILRPVSKNRTDITPIESRVHKVIANAHILLFPQA